MPEPSRRRLYDVFLMTTAVHTPFVPKSDPFLAQLMRWAGVTRVAAVTGLDRTGVPVACAVRPGGHVLQVTSGKGISAEAAAYSAVVEALELQLSEAVPVERCLFASAASLSVRARVVEVKGGSAGRDLDEALTGPGLVRGWRSGVELLQGGELWVPAAAVHCPPPDGPLLGPASVSWSSNGLGAGRTLGAAMEHAVCEVVERDQLARAFPEGWTPASVRNRRLPRKWVERHAKATAKLLEAMEPAFEAFLFEVPGPPGRPPVAAAVLFDVERGPVPVSAGYACRTAPGEAVLAALLEAAQSRATDIHGAREDIAPMPAEDVEALHRLCRSTRERPPSWKPVSFRGVLRQLASEGLGPVAAVMLTAEEDPLQVVKVVAPRLRSSELL